MSADAPVRPVSGDALEERPSGLLQEVRPSARCHACGDGVVVAVCSRCARLLCRVHDSAAGPLGPRAILRLLRANPDDETATTPSTTADKAKPNKVGVKERAADRGPQGAGSTADGAPADKKDRSAGEKADDLPRTDPVPAADPADGQAAGGDRTPSSDRARERRAPAGDEVSSTDTPPASKRRKPERRRRERPRGAAQRHYCMGCVPQVRPYDAEILAATMTGGIGVFLLPVQHVVGVLFVAAGAVRCAVRVVQDLLRRSRLATERSAGLVLNPNLRKVKTRELIRVAVRLDDDRQYEEEVEPAVGSVRIEGNWSRVHRTELARHRRRTRTDSVTAAAGHLVLHGPARVAFRTTPDAAANGGPALVLEPRVADQEVLVTRDGHGDTRWRPEFRYDIAAPENGWTSPLWLTPNIAADLERHVLELHVQWSTRKPDPPHAGVPLRVIEALELHVPAHWGTVEHMTGLGEDCLIGQPDLDESDGIARRKLVWKRVRFPEGKDRDIVRFAVRFSDAIDTEHPLKGRLEARFGGAVSGLTRVGLYRTDGAPVKKLDGVASPQTVVKLDFNLSLKGLRYQQQRVVPDRSRAEDGKRQETHLFPGVAPDHRTIALLTNNLADEGYYIIRVLENPAQPGRRAGSVNRLWDLMGRYYEGVYPIDFHLVLSGEQIHKGQEVTGETSVMLNVAGSYANEVMEQRVVEEWTRLWKRIRLSLRAAGGERLTTEPLDTPSSELARLRNVMVTETARLSAAADAGRMDPDLSTDIVARLTREFGLEER